MAVIATMMVCLVMAAISMFAARIALVVEVVATGKKVQTGTQQ